MDIRTLTGNSISEALSEARSLWGDSVIMLQAERTSTGTAAKISVGIPAEEGSGKTPVGVAVADRPTRKAPTTPALAPGQMRRRDRGTRRPLAEGRVKPMAEVLTHIGSSAVAPEPIESSRPEPSEELVPKEPMALHPGFSKLVSRGIRPSRAKRICDSGTEIREMEGAVEALLPSATHGRAPSRVAFVGESGSGKTSLILRAAMSRLKAGRRAPSIVIVSPSQEDFLGWQDPTTMLETIGLDVVRCSADALESALAGLAGDVLVDTPAGFSMPPNLGLHTRLVVDARSSGSATACEGEDADSVVLTHADQTDALGYAAERLMSIGLPVAAIVRSSRPDSGLQAYSPRRLARQLCA